MCYVKTKYDESLDGKYTQELLEQRASEKYAYKSNRPILLFDKRPTDPNKFFEYVLMICVYFGAPLHVENQKYAIINYFHHRGCGDFIMHKYQQAHKHDKVALDGTPSSQPLIQQYTSLVAFQKEYFCHLMPFREMLEDNLVFDPMNTKVHDYTVAEGFCELACQMLPSDKAQNPISITDFFHTFDRDGELIN